MAAKLQYASEAQDHELLSIHLNYTYQKPFFPFLLENGNSDESDSNEQPDKRKQIQRSPKAKRTQRAPGPKKVQTKTRTKPAVHVTVESTSSTSPSDEQVRNLTIKGKAVKGRPVRDPQDDETFLVSSLILTVLH